MADIAALNTVYNHFMTTYAPEGTNTKYDTHKKSELRGVYNSIVKMNKDAPLFLLDTSPKTQEFAVSLKEGARSLKNVISSVTPEDSELLSQKTVSSSHESIVTASYVGETSEAPVSKTKLNGRPLTSPTTLHIPFSETYGTETILFDPSSSSSLHISLFILRNSAYISCL